MRYAPAAFLKGEQKKAARQTTHVGIGRAVSMW